MSRFILITRHPSDCVELQILLNSCGLKLRPYPVLRLRSFSDPEGWRAAKDLVPSKKENVWLVFASPRAAEPFTQACREHDAEHLLQLPVAVVGKGTARSAKDLGLRPEIIGPGTGLGLARELQKTLPPASTIVFACGRDRRHELPEALIKGGHTVLPVIVYRMDPTPPRELPPLGPGLEAVVLTSPRAASLYLEGVGGLPLPCSHWAMGPTTQNAAAALGIECKIPAEPNLESLAEELCKI